MIYILRKLAYEHALVCYRSRICYIYGDEHPFLYSAFRKISQSLKFCCFEDF